MSDNVDTDNSQNNIPQNPEINDRFDVVQREIDQMENFVEANLTAHIPDPVPNNDIEPEMNLGLGLEPQQQLDQQGNELGGVAVAEPVVVAEPEPIVENPQPLQGVNDHQLPDISFDPVIMDQSSWAMKELLKMARQRQIYPFGDQRSNNSEDSESEFQPSIAFYEPNNEISREIAIMDINRIGVIELLMQASLMSSAFPDIVASAKLIREILPGTVDYDGTLQIMRIEYHIPSPLASTRECYILRYSRKIREDMWAVVDQSLDDLFGFDGITYRRNWSGCTIIELPYAHTKVTWLENVEVNNNSMHHQMLQEIVGHHFGAKRWIYAYVRESYWLNSPIYTDRYFKGNKTATRKGARNIFLLAEKMIHKFFANASPSQKINNWVAIPGTEEIRVAIKPYPDNVEVDAGGKSVVVIATTAPIPVFQNELFQLLSDPQSRRKWDLVATKYKIQEKLRINLGDGNYTGNFVCVFQFSKTEGVEPAITYLQRSYTDSVMSYTVFTPVEVPIMKMLLNGTGDPEEVDILESGFVVFPDSNLMNSEFIHGGSLLTAVFQFFDHVPDDGILSSDSAETARSIMEDTMSLIKDAVIRGNRRTREGGFD